jgi:MFS family permease
MRSGTSWTRKNRNISLGERYLSNPFDNLAKFIPKLLSNGIPFFERQHRDWKVTVARTSMDKLTYQMVFPYLSIYIVGLGASATQLGLVNSIGMMIAGILGPFTGLLIDRIGPKKIYLAGITLMAVCYLTYGLAQSWGATIIAMIAYWLGYSTSILSCATICGNCLVNRDRATGMMICETVTAGLLGMAGPMIATWVVRQSGGVNSSGIRPLFFLGLILTVAAFVLVLTQLSNQQWAKTNRTTFFKEISQVFKTGRYLKRWIVIAAASQLPIGMVFPFSQVFAYKVKGANELILGAMVTASALSSIVFAIPLGRWADRTGRKKVLFMTTIPLFLLSNLVLILAPGPTYLVLAGILQGFYFIGTPISAAIERELVPPEHMGRWVGITRFSKMILSAILALTAGMIWDQLGPKYIFISYIAIDLLIRVPLLMTIPETLNRRFKSEAKEDIVLRS